MKKVGFICLFLLARMTGLYAQLWQTVGGGLDGFVSAFFGDPASNTLYVGGAFHYGGGTYLGQVGALVNNQWVSLDSGLQCGMMTSGAPASIIDYDSLLFLAGGHTRCEDWTRSLHTWDGNQWEFQGVSNTIALLGIANNDLFALGGFDTLGFLPISRLGRWTGNGWEQFGDTAFLNTIYMAGSIAYFQGNYFMGGNYNTWPDPSEIAMWDGSQWSIPGGGIKGDSWVNRLEVYDSVLWVAGLFDRNAGNAGNHVMTWDGTQWADPLPNVYFTTQANDMRLWGGELYFLGTHYVYSNGAWQGPRYIGKYDGTQFCSFGGPDLAIQSMGYLNGRLFAGSIFQPGQEIYGYCAEWIGGNQMDFCVQQGPLSIQPRHQDAARLVVFPNPAVDQVEVRLEGDRIHDLQLYDLLGRQMEIQWRPSGSNQATLDVSQLPPGTYLLQCISNSGEYTAARFVRL